MSRATAIILLLLTPFLAAAPSEDRSTLPADGFFELYNSTLEKEDEVPEQLDEEAPIQLQDEILEPLPKEVSKASMPTYPGPPQITIPMISPNVPIAFPRPFSIPFPFPFPAPPPPPQFPNLDVVQVITVPRPQKSRQTEDDEMEEADDENEDLDGPVEIPVDSILEGRRAPTTDRRKKPKKQKKQKKQKIQKKQKKQKKQKTKKRPATPPYPQPIIIYQSQDEPTGTDTLQPAMTGAQGAQTSYLGYYMVYVVEVRWTGNNYTQTVVTGRPIPAAITVPTATEPGIVNSLSETISPANLVNGNRPQPTPTCLFQRSTTTENVGTQQEIFKPLESTDNPVVEEANGNPEQIGEEPEDSDELDSVDEDYEDDSDPKRKKKRKGIQLGTTDAPKQQ